MCGQALIPLRDALPEMMEIELDQTMMERVRNGYQPTWQELGQVVNPGGVEQKHVKLSRHNQLIAIVEVNRAQVGGDYVTKIRRVFL
jgi:hypothetical protein